MNGQQPCCETMNNFGWRIVLGIPGVLALILALLRIFAFPAFESPKLLVSQGKQSAAIVVLDKVAQFNGRFPWLTEQILREVSEDSTNKTVNDATASRILRMLGKVDMVRWLQHDAALRRTTMALFVGFPSVGLAYP